MNEGRGTVIHAEVYLEDCTAELCLNGIPIFTNLVEKCRQQQSIQVNTFVVPNLNVLELAVDIDTQSPSVSRRVRHKAVVPSAVAIARLVRYPLQEELMASPENGEVLATLSWNAGDDPFATSPKEMRAFAELGPAFGARVWQGAPQLTLDQATRDEAITLLETIRTAMRQGDTATMLNLLDLRARDVALAYQGNIDAEERRQGFIEWLAQFAAEPDRVLPLDMDALDFRLVAERRLLVPHTNQFRGALRLRIPKRKDAYEIIGETIVSYEIRFARIDGWLRIVA